MARSINGNLRGMAARTHNAQERRERFLDLERALKAKAETIKANRSDYDKINKQINLLDPAAYSDWFDNTPIIPDPIHWTGPAFKAMIEGMAAHTQKLEEKNGRK